MGFDVSVNEKNRIISIVWNGTVDLASLKRHLLTYNYHISHTDHNVLYDFRNVSNVILDDGDLAQVADLSKKIFDPLLKDIKVAMLSSKHEILELEKLFVSRRLENSPDAPTHNFFDDIDKAMNWLMHDE